jgi:methylmalonyl-CoA mutase cobalamin-binding subunit
LSTPNKNEEVITRVKHLVYSSSDAVVQTGAIDTLATFGESAIDAINEIIGLSSISDGVKEHGLKTIEYIKENSS